jgi:chitin disaccharide deacetylase
MNRTRLIVNADDFGMSRGTTDGILLAHRYGYLTSASLMVNMPASEYAVSHAASAPELGIGIHLNICSGKPVSPASQVPSLVGADSNFHPPAVLIRRLWHWQVSVRELEMEFRAQVRWMKARGLHPTHADSHHHMHIYPAAAIPFLRALLAEGVRCARASRCTQFPRGNSMGGPHEGSLARRLLVQSYRSALQSTLFLSLVSPDSRISFLSRDRRDLARLGLCWKSAFANLPPGAFELACHPGFFEKGFSESDPIRLQREEELQWLTDREFRRVLDRRGIQLITYNQLSGERAEVRAAQHAAAH